MAARTYADDCRRTDLWHYNPFDLELRDELRGRSRPPTDGDILAMAESIMKHGQRQPVQCRPDGDKLVVVMGFTRTAACRLIREGFTDPAGVFQKDENFQIKTTIANVNEAEGFVHNIVENCHRNATSPVDDAMNQERLRDRYGYADAAIAELYGRDPRSVARLKRLLTADHKTRELVHDGRMAVETAITLLDIPSEDERRRIIEECMSAETGRVSPGSVNSKLRAKIIADSGGDPDEAAPAAADPGQKRKYKPLSNREFRDFFRRQMTDVADDRLKLLAKALVEFIEGRRSETGMLKSLARVLEPAAAKPLQILEEVAV